MDYQEAIYCMKVMAEEEVCEECKYYQSCDHTKQADMARIAISAMRELQELYSIGTAEELREAIEKQKECKNCGYKIHSDGISKLNSCNDCGLSNTCVKRPEYGQYCRINCYDWRKRE